MIIHDHVRIEDDTVLFFKFQEEIVIELFSPSVPKEPRFVMALPGDMKESVILKNEFSGCSHSTQ